MKNVLKFAAVSAVAISAVAAAPVTQADAAATEAQPGFYDTADNKFYTAAQFKVLTSQQKAALLTKSGVYLYVSKDLVISGLDATNAKTDADVLEKAVKASDLPTIDFDAIYNGGVATPVAELKVESVSAITTTGVDVTFPALTGDIDGATVEVKNSNGEVVAVNTVNLKEGDKVASFDFTTAVSESDLTGVWTVDGVEFSFNEKELVERILEVAGGTSDVLVLESLSNAGIENVNEDLASGYKNAINEADPEPTSLAEIQKIVDTENVKYGKVKAVIDGSISLMGEEVKVYNALKAGFENVESRWSEEYLEAYVKLADGTTSKIGDLGREHYTGVKAVSYEAIQDAVNRVAVYETAQLVEDLYADEPKAEEISTAKGLVAKYAGLAYKVEDEVTYGDYLTDRFTKLELLVNIDKATTKAAVKSALTKLGDFEATLAEKYDGVTTVTYILPTNSLLTTQTASVDPGFEENAYTLKANVDAGFVINDANLEEYIKAVDAATWANKDSAADIVARVIAVNNAQSVNLIDNLADEATAYHNAGTPDAEKRPAYLKALQAVGAKRVVSNNLEFYADTTNGIAAAFATLDTGSGDDLEDVQNIVDAANIYVVSKLATDNKASELVNALKALEIKDLTIEAANKDYYLEEIKADSLGGFDAATVSADLTAIEESVKAANVSAATATSLKALNAATTAAEAKTALDALSAATSLTQYAGVPAADKEYIAGKLIEVRDLLTAERNVVLANGTKDAGTTTSIKAKEFRTVNEVIGYLTSSVTETVADIDFNDDDDTSDTRTSVLAERTALINGLNAVVTNVPGTATTYTLDVTDVSVDNTVTYTSDNAAIEVDNTGAVTITGTVADGDTATITAEVNGVTVNGAGTVVTVSENVATGEFSLDVTDASVDNTVTYTSDNAAIEVDNTGAVTITGTVADGDTATITAEVNGVTVNGAGTTVTVSGSTDPVAYEQFLIDTATAFKGLKVPGFSKASAPVSSADIALVEKYFNSAAFYTLADENASSTGSITAGDLKAPFRTVSEILVYFK